MSYSLTSGSSVVRGADGACIPDDPRNTDWQAYRAWLAAGNIPAPVAGPTPAQLAAALVCAASSACATIVAQIFPDPAHQAAFQNAASLINGNAGAAPLSSALASKFSGLAAVYGLSASGFATLVVALQGASLDLSTALGTLDAAAAAATTSAALASAVTAFEAALAAVVTEVNAAVPELITAPTTISIVGVNA